MPQARDVNKVLKAEMQIYLVGGAVRDKLLNIKVKDNDWVVVGATSDDMSQNGFIRVGKDFPVFLHPKTKEEYALARTERKIGAGYTGFSTIADSTVTLEEDLLRRDLTINAIAQDDDGNLVDPYGGQKDLASRTLRHVSEAFVEDPLRVFRVARFAARFHKIGFTVAQETMHLMQEIAKTGEIKTLSAERVWQETERALSEPSPQVYFEVLHQAGALNYWFEELEQLWGVPNPEKWHPEIDTGVHSLMALQQASELSESVATRFAALLHDLGKGVTPQSQWPSHRGHEKEGIPLVKALCQRIKTTNECKELALLTAELHGKIHTAKELRPDTVVKLFDQVDAWRKPERFEQLLVTCIADARGRLNMQNNAYPQADYLRKALTAANDCDVQEVIKNGFKGPQIREQLNKLRVEAVKLVRESCYPN